MQKISSVPGKWIMLIWKLTWSFQVISIVAHFDPKSDLWLMLAGSCSEIQELFPSKDQVMNQTNDKKIFKWDIFAYDQFC